jgi:hypothetical protein
MRNPIPKPLIYPLALDLGVAIFTFGAISITRNPMQQTAGSPINPETFKTIMFLGSIIGIYSLAFVLGRKAVVGGAYYLLAITAALIPVTVLQTVAGFARHSTSYGTGFCLGAVIALVTLVVMNIDLAIGPGARS